MAATKIQLPDDLFQIMVVGTVSDSVDLSFVDDDGVVDTAWAGSLVVTVDSGPGTFTPSNQDPTLGVVSTTFVASAAGVYQITFSSVSGSTIFANGGDSVTFSAYVTATDDEKDSAAASKSAQAFFFE